MRFGIPVSGTMAHSYVQAHETEEAAFVAFARANRQSVTFLLDTYDTEAAAAKVVALAPGLKAEGLVLHAVRLDSGDLAAHARNVRRILDDGGLRDVRIFASGNLDENELDRLVHAGAPIDGFGVGTRVDVSADAPYLDCAYKIQEYAGRPLRKRSEGKATWPGRKQVCRCCGDDGRLTLDTLMLEGEKTDGTPLVIPVMRNGKRAVPPTPLAELRGRAAAELARLPPALQKLETAKEYSVQISPGLRALTARLDRVGPARGGGCG
jgi:nicotinate phosphoribosyltransferase